MGRAEVILDTVHNPLVTPPAIRYRHAHGDSRRGFRGSADADRGGRRELVAPHVGAVARAARLAVSVRTGASPRGAGTGAGGRGGSARRRVAPGREGRAFPGGFAEVAARQEPGQARGGRRGGEGGPPRGEGRAVLPGGSGAAGEASLASRRRFEQAQHDRVAAHGSLPVARSLAGLGSAEGYDRASARRHPPAAQGCAGSGEGHDRAAVEGERPTAQGPGAVAGAEGRTRGVAQEGRGASQVETDGAGVAAPGERPAAQGSGTDAEAEGHDQGAARGSRFLEPGGPSAEPGERPAAPRAGAVGGPQGDSTPAVRRGQAAARGAGGIPQPDGPHRFAEEARRLSGNCPEEVRHREGGAGSPTRRASPAGRGRQEIARSGQDRRVAAQGERRAGQEDKGAAGSQRETGRPDCPAPFDPCRLVEGGLREQERTAGEARHGAQARPAARCARPRPHPAARARG